MPVTFEAVENGRTMLLTINDPWTIEELMEWYPIMQPYFDSAASKVHTIIDLSSTKTLASGVLKGRHSPNMEHPNGGFVVAVGTSGVVRSIAEIAFQLSRNNRLKFMSDVSQAMTFLKKQIELESLEGDRHD